MVQHEVRYKKGIAIELRKKGLSYAEIQNLINIPKSTIAYWVSTIELTEIQKEKLSERRSRIARKNSQKKTERTLEKVKMIEAESAKAIQQISKRELWLMGVVLYWRERLSERNKTDLRKGIRFTNANPTLINFFIKWLLEVGKIDSSEIKLDLFLGRNHKKDLNKILSFWQKSTNLAGTSFGSVYYYKHYAAENGLLRVRVKASSDLARQISGWIIGIGELLITKR